MKGDAVLFIALGVIFLTTSKSFGKPTETVETSDVPDPIASYVNTSSKLDTKREQRSPQFGLLGGSDYSDYDYGARHFGSRRKHHHKPYHGFGGGCRGYNCGGGWQPDYGGHHHAGQGASFASASAGSVSGGGPYGGGHSQANAQSASFNIGPFSATFSAAQSSAGNTGF
ncbi:dormancy-associated protein 2-like [Pseudomyrmex gracilis]|uniref:dormancy-associated protein 2-like n=1 Tax=Pseudomyrmex gracilis TaxID=219809 RepID=UPI000995038B|nr:dormancy-associated protein 2-like [Pseudomyrmex gracilis]